MASTRRRSTSERLCGTLVGATLAACAPARLARSAPPPDELSDAALSPPESFADERRQLLRAAPSAATFAGDGPFAYAETENLPLTLPTGERLLADLDLPESAAPPPLVILVHGNHGAKEAHRYQARRLATFGIAALAVQLPNVDHWIENGRTLARLTRHLPATLHVDPTRIILAGHSFGGTAVAVAAGAGAACAGLVLLDPALLDEHVPPFLPRVKAPAMLIGADPAVFRARRQERFYQMIGAPMASVRIVGATHNDAESPSMFALSAYGLDPFTSPAKQATFTALLTASAFSLAATGKLDYAYAALKPWLGAGLKEARRRAAPPVQGGA